ncbi:MAG: hypothetical protein V4736_02895, partial [Bdellovibrionota bacterium]
MASPYFTLEGELFLSPTSTSPLLDAAAIIRIQILNPSATCILYDEQQTVDTNTTSGSFNIRIGSELGDTKRVGGSDPGNTVFSVYQNKAPMPAGGCGTYTPTAGDGRLLRIIVTPSSTGVPETLTPDMNLDGTPLALVAETLQGKGRDDFLNLNTVVPLTQSNVENVFSATNYPIMAAILDGTTTTYEKVGKLNGLALPALAANQTFGWNGTAFTAITPVVTETDPNVSAFAKAALPTCGAGQVLKDNGSGGLTCVAVGSGSVTSVATGTGLTGGPITTTGTVSIAAGGVSATELATGAVTTGKILDGTITGADLKGDISIATTGSISADTSITTTGAVNGASAVFSGNVGSNSVSTRTLGISNASNNTVSITANAGAFTNFSLVLPTTYGTSSQVLTSDGAGNLVWASNSAGAITGLSGDVTASGTGVVATTIAANAVTTAKILDANVTTAKINDKAVTFSKMLDIATSRLLGRSTAGSGSPEEISIGSGMSLSGGILTSTALLSINNTADLSNGRIWIGNGANKAVEHPVSGDASLSIGGALTIVNDAITTSKILDSNITTSKLNNQAVTYSKIQNISATNKLLGRASAGAGSTEEISLGSGLSMSGSTLSVSSPTVVGSALNSANFWLGNGSNTAQQVSMSGDASMINTGAITIANDAVSFAKIQNINSARLIGRSTSGSGDPEELSVGGGLSIAGGVLSVLSTPATVSNSSTLNNGLLWLGDGTNLAQERLMSGDASISSLGIISIAPNAVTTSKILDSAVTTAKL